MALKSSKELGFDFYTKSRFDKGVAFLFTMIIVGGIIVPVFILYLVRRRSGNIQNAVTLSFTTFFALLCSTCTSAKRHEIFAATAA
jgi:phosphoglycerol transferase MdoB-like AlkP superfamily enzyme